MRIQIEKGRNYHFIGKVGRFCPIKDDCGGDLLMRKKDGWNVRVLAPRDEGDNRGIISR